MKNNQKNANELKQHDDDDSKSHLNKQKIEHKWLEINEREETKIN